VVDDECTFVWCECLLDLCVFVSTLRVKHNSIPLWETTRLAYRSTIFTYIHIQIFAYMQLRIFIYIHMCSILQLHISSHCSILQLQHSTIERCAIDLQHSALLVFMHYQLPTARAYVSYLIILLVYRQFIHFSAVFS